MGLLSIFRQRAFWAFFGTGLIVSVAYMDPGNWGASISAGAKFNYDLLWVVWLSSGMAMLFQYLSGKMGLAGHSLAGMVREQVKSRPLLVGYWLLAEAAVLATDLAEYLGIVVALHLLFGIPMLTGAFLAMLDVFLLLLLTRKGIRPLEYAFIVFVSVIGLGYLYEIFLSRPDFAGIALGSVTPTLNAEMALYAVSIIGATVMPHALFVHSWLMQEKARRMRLGPKALPYHLADDVLSLFLAGLVNAAILIMAAAAFYSRGIAVATIDKAYLTLEPLFGRMASVVFGVALLAAGISSSITGTLAGQSIMESLTDFRLSPLLRRIITRVINVVPIVIAILLHAEPLQILVWSQALLSLLLPVPLIPLILFTAKKDIMGTLRNRPLTTAVSALFALIILGFNGYMLYSIARG